jgi:protein TonB
MRVTAATVISGLFHAALLAVMALPMTDAWLARFEIARGQPVVVQMTLPSAPPAPSQPIAIELDVPPPPPVETQPVATSAAELLEPAPTELSRQAMEEVVVASLPAEVETTSTDAPNVPQPAERQPLDQPLAATEVAAALPRQEAPPQETPTETTAAVPLVQSEATGAEVDQLPQKLPTNAPPVYPLDALLAGIEGRVLLRVLVNAEGVVDAAEVDASSGSASLDRAALAAVLGWRFRAALRRGLPVAHEVLVPVRFSIRGG